MIEERQEYATIGARAPWVRREKPRRVLTTVELKNRDIVRSYLVTSSSVPIIFRTAAFGDRYEGNYGVDTALFNGDKGVSLS